MSARGGQVRFERFDRAPEPAALDARLAAPCAALITAEPPARAALSAVCAERGVPCLVALPVDPDPRAWEPLAGSLPARVLALAPALAGPGVARALDLASRGALGPLRAVHVVAGARPGDAGALAEAVCLALAALPADASVVASAAGREGALAEIELRAGEGLFARVRLDPEAAGLELTLEGMSARASVGVRDGRETLALERGGERREVAVPAHPPGARLMAALLAPEAPPAWLGVRHARRAWELCCAALGAPGDPRPPLPPGAGDSAAWRAVASAAREARNPREALLAAGLESSVPVPDDAPDAPADRGGIDVDRLEAFAFDAGIKPALYLTVPRAQVDELRARYAAHHVESVEYTLTRDPLSDARARVNAPPGAGTHVDLFVCRDRQSARRAREIYQDPRGPSVYLAEMGALLGYPPCCVAAFAALPDRSNNSANRHACRARTAALGAPFVPALNNLFAHVVPFFPCSYACPRGQAAALGVLEALAAARPDAAAGLRASLARPVLYADHARHVSLAGAARDGSVVRYTGVVASPAEPGDAGAARLFRAGLAGVLADGDGLRDAGSRWEVLRGDRVVATLTRRAPGLVVLFPFGL